MGKRSNKPRHPRDYYKTPMAVADVLFEHLWEFKTFIEPCAGDGQLVRAINGSGACACVYAGDIEPQDPSIDTHDALRGLPENVEAECIVTNPPYMKEVLFPLMDLWIASGKPVFLLLNADFAYNKQSSKYMKKCEKIISVGRVKWFPESNHSSLENFAWFKFVGETTKTQFIGRKS